jgi:hypothetical protein
MELDTAVSQGADAGATPVGSYNFTESGNNTTVAVSNCRALLPDSPRSHLW